MDLIYRFAHEMCLMPSLRLIENLYWQHEMIVAAHVRSAWDEWVLLDSHRALFPEIYGFGGTLHQLYLSSWFPFRTKVMAGGLSRVT